MQLTPVQKLSLTIGAVLTVLGIFGGMSYYFSSRLVKADRAVEQANANMSNAFRLVTGRQEAERLAKAYVVRPDTATRTLLQSTQSRVEDAIDAMARGTEDNPHQVKLMKELANRASASFDAFRTTLLVRDRAGPEAARRVLSRALPERTDSLMAIVADFRTEELRVLAERTRLQSAHSENAQRIILVGMLLTFLLAAIALQPLREDVALRLTTHIVREHESAGDVLSDAARRRAASVVQLRAICDLTDELARANNPAAIGHALAVAAVSALHPAFAAAVIPGAHGGLAVLGASDDRFAVVDTFVATPVIEVLRSGAPVMAESRQDREHRWEALDTLDALGATGSALFAPLTGVHAVAGVLMIVCAEDRCFGDDELRFVATLGRLGGTALASRPPA